MGSIGKSTNSSTSLTVEQAMRNYVTYQEEGGQEPRDSIAVIDKAVNDAQWVGTRTQSDLIVPGVGRAAVDYDKEYKSYTVRVYNHSGYLMDEIEFKKLSEAKQYAKSSLKDGR